MTHTSCSSCRLRFTGPIRPATCPRCDRGLEASTSAADVIGYQVFVSEDLPDALPEAIAVSVSMPDPRAPGP